MDLPIDLEYMQLSDVVVTFFCFWLLFQHVSVNENMFHVTDWYHIVIQAKCKVRGIFQLTFWKGAIREMNRPTVISTIVTEKPLGWPFKGIIQLEIYYRAWKCKKIISLVTLSPYILDAIWKMIKPIFSYFWGVFLNKYPKIILKITKKIFWLYIHYLQYVIINYTNLHGLKINEGHAIDNSKYIPSNGKKLGKRRRRSTKCTHDRVFIKVP